MTMTAPAWPRRSFSQLLDRWADALIGPRRHAAVVVALAAYCGVWTVYRIISTLPRDVHFDMSELYAWSLAPAFGYDKHPPFAAFVVRGWFAIWPVEDWSFSLLAMANVSLTLYITWRILERWTNPAKAAFGLALLMVIPFYNFHALKYNANTVLLPIWALTGYAFLRAYETRSAPWSLLAGIAAGAAMLGKYWSVFLVAGLAAAALIDRRRWAFLKSPAPYLMVLAGGLTLAPHLRWLTTHSDAFAYAGARLEGQGDFSLPDALIFVSGIIGYAIPALAAWALILRPKANAIRAVAWPADDQRRLALLCFLLPNLLPLLPARWTGFQLTPLWTLPGYSLLPLVLLATPKIDADRRAVKWMACVAAGISLLALAASPIVALTFHLRTDPRPGDYGSLLAGDVTAAWSGLSKNPIPLVASCGGNFDVALAVAYDLRQPARLSYGKQGLGTRAELLSQGGVIVGAADDPECPPQGASIVAMRPGTVTLATTYKPSLFGFPGRPLSYRAYIVPPP